MFCSLVIAPAIVLLGLQFQQDDGPPKADSRPDPDVAAKLRAESSQLESGHASDFFLALVQAIESGNGEGVERRRAADGE